MKKHIHKLKKHFTKHYNKAIKQKSTPHSIAIGFAIGSFIAIFPTFGLGLLIVLFIMLFYKTMNKIAAIAGLAFWNFIMMVPIFYLSPRIGNFIIGNSTNLNQSSYKITTITQITPFTFSNIMTFLSGYAKNYLIGNSILAVTFSILSYFIIKESVIGYRYQKQKRLEHKLEKSRLSKKLSK